jgi:tRNA G18 (ribose-2'-O)-methylase SpoU
MKNNKKTLSTNKKKGDSFYIFGLFPVVEAIRNNPKDILTLMIDPSKKRGEYLNFIFSEAKKKKIPFSDYDKNKVKKLFSEKENTQGVIALVKGFEYQNLAD